MTAAAAVCSDNTGQDSKGLDTDKRHCSEGQCMTKQRRAAK